MFRRFAALLFACLLGLLAVAGLLTLSDAGRVARAAPASPHTNIIVTTTIQAAIDAASPGDTVLAPAGIYTESLNLDKAVSLHGAFSNTTIVVALPNQRVITITGASLTNSVVISGLTFRDGNVAGDGGGVWLTDGAQPLLQNLILQNNIASGFGGGLYAEAGATLIGVQLISNTAPNGGGGWVAAGDVRLSETLIELNTSDTVGGLRVDNGNVWLTDTLVLSNTALTQNSGGLWANGSATLVGGRFENNRGVGNGGGFYAGAGASVTGTLFISNTTSGSGGGGYITGGAQSWLTNTTFISNTAQNGGGLQLNGGGVVSGGVFQANTVPNNGGGLNVTGALTLWAGARFVGNRASLGGAVSQSVGDVLVTNALFARNRATGLGNALYLAAVTSTITIRHSTVASPTLASGSAIVVQGTTNISNTIIVNQGAGIQRFSGSVSEDYNLFFGNLFTTTNLVSSGGHSLVANPAFVDLAADDYHLTPASAALDLGANADVSDDFEGDPRPQGGGYDIGWDEAPYTATPDLGVSQTVTPVFALTDTPLTYTIAFSNTGAVGYNVVITDLVPGELISVTTLNSGAPLTPTAGMTYTWQAGTLLPGASGLITITGVVSAPMGVFTNTVEITATNGDLNPADNIEAIPFIVTRPTTPPTLSDTGDQTSYVGAPLTFTVVVSDVETPVIDLILTGSSSNQASVPDANILIGAGSADGERTITLTAVMTGTATITLTVTDSDFATASDTFTLTVEVEQPKLYLPLILR